MGSYTSPIFCSRGNPLPPSSEILEAGRNAVADNAHYADPLGKTELRESISFYLQRELGVTYDPDREVIVTAGASPAIFSSLIALTSPGDTILLPNPGWPTYTQMVGTLGRRVVGYPMNPFFPQPALFANIRPKAIIVNSPHNPTGAVLRHEHFMAIEKLCDAFPEMVVISDETYDGLVYDGLEHSSPCSHPPLTSKTIQIRSFSKTWSIPGWRIGYLAGPGDFVEQIKRFHLAICAFPSCSAQQAATWVLNNGQAIGREFRKRYQHLRDLLIRQLAGVTEFRANTPKGTPYLFIPVPISGRTMENELATQYNLHLLAGENFGDGGKDHVRICFALSEDEINELAARLSSYARERLR